MSSEVLIFYLSVKRSEAYEEGYLKKLEALTIVPQKKNRLKQRTIIAVSTLVLVLGITWHLWIPNRLPESMG